MATRTIPTYWDYLRLDDLLSLQGGFEGDDSRLMPDELHFIVVHQAFELWFKLILRELRLARDHLAAPKVPEETVPHVVHHLRRVNAIFGHAADQFNVMETLTPQDFLAFRDKLAPASGFQSFQLREIEILLGLDDAERRAEAGLDPLASFRHAARASASGARAWERIEAARRERSLRETLRDWLYRTPIQGSQPDEAGDAAAVESFLRQYLAAHAGMHRDQAAQIATLEGRDSGAVATRFAQSEREAEEFLLAADVDEKDRPRARRVRAGLLFVESYRTLPLLAWPRLLIDTIVELEELFVLWRTRHARMVERTIGRRMGTGGSSGVDYLDQTTRYRVFTELWAVRTLLLPRQYLPALENAEKYGFAI